jgi:hypothetical protein
MSHALRADRLLIRPASGRQAGNGFLARTNRSKDTQRGHPYAESQTRNTDTNVTRAQTGPSQSHSPYAGSACRGARFGYGVRV